MSGDRARATAVGLVLGRFQPLHPGHLYLIDRAFQENSEVVVCIGSAQAADPLTIEERHERMRTQLTALYPQRSWRIVDLIDPDPPETWVSYVIEACEIYGPNKRFYRSDPLPSVYEGELALAGFSVVYLSRQPFYYLCPDGVYRLLDSASAIKNVYAQLGLSLNDLKQNSAFTAALAQSGVRTHP